MYLSRLTLTEHPDLHAIVQRMGDAYREHQMLWQLFDPQPDAERDFLYRREIRRGRPSYFLLSHRPPVNPLGLWQIDPPKLFAPRLQTGQRLAFSLRVNPVVNHDGKRHDIVMHRKRQMGWNRMPSGERPPLQHLIHETGSDWLQRRSERHGFEIEPDLLRVEGYLQHYSRRGRRNIRFSTLDFAGLLRVTKPDVFGEALSHGIGPAKAFGCGLMLIRRA